MSKMLMPITVNVNIYIHWSKNIIEVHVYVSMYIVILCDIHVCNEYTVIKSWTVKTMLNVSI